jgi:ligand-binding sensor domain-containing protein/signal transduction histidine kinase
MIQRRRLRKWLLAASVGICLVRDVRALDPTKSMSQYIHDKWGADRGFLGGAVTSIAQSSDGYLWIGTERGLVRFDGFNFTLFQQPIPDAPDIGPVRGLALDAEGSLWIRLESPDMLRYRDGKFEDVLSRYDLQNITFTAMCPDRGGGLLLTGLGNVALRYHGGKFDTIANPSEVPGTVISVAVTRDGKVWMGTRDDGLFRMDDGHFTNVSQGLTDKKINVLLPAVNGELWIGTDTGVQFFNRSERNTPHLPSSIGRLQILAMALDRDGNIWVGTDHGLFRITPAGAVSLEQLSQKPGSEVTAIFQDRDGDIWFGGPSGIERLRDGMFTTYSTSDGLPSESSGPVYVDPTGRTWFAPLAGGLYWMKDNRVERVTVAGLDRDIVYSISGRDGEVWVGRQRGGLTELTQDGDSFAARTYTRADGLVQNSVYSVHRSRDGTVWAGTVSAGVSRLKDGKFTNYSTAQGLAANSVYAIVEGYDGTMWFATSGGLDSFAHGRWVNHTAFDGLPSNDVKSIFEDSRHAIWIATSAGLAYFVDGRLGVPHNLPESLHEQIFGITEDTLGFLWFATSDHVVQVNRDRLAAGSIGDSDLQSYGIADGLQGVEGVGRDRSMITDPMGRIWISLNRGLAVGDPKGALANSAPVSVRIQAVSAAGAEIDLSQSPRIAAGTRSITFDYASTNLSTPQRIRFRYKLDGSDQGWSEAVSLRQVIYKNLGPGLYRFHVVASDSQGLWNGAETTASFVIERAFWQTWWFQAACVVVCLLLAWAVYRLRMYSLTRRLDIRFQERLAERTRIAQELHDTLLQSFQGLLLRFQTVDHMLLTRPHEAKRALEGALDRADQALNESRDAIQGIRSSGSLSLDLGQAMNALMTELNEEFHAGSVNGPAFCVLEEGTPRAVHPVVRDEVCRIAREALRNAFSHAQARLIETEITYDQDLLRLRFRDDGRGLDPSVLDHGGCAGHWGLVGMKERAKRMGAQLDIWSKPGAGTELELQLPGSIAYETSPARARFRFFRRKVEDRNDRRP